MTEQESFSGENMDLASQTLRANTEIETNEAVLSPVEIQQMTQRLAELAVEKTNTGHSLFRVEGKSTPEISDQESESLTAEQKIDLIKEGRVAKILTRPDDLPQTSNRERSERLKQRLAEINDEIQKIVSHPGIAQNYQRFFQEQLKQLKLAREYESLGRLQAQIIKQEIDLFKHHHGDLAGADRQIIAENQQINQTVIDRQSEILANPDVALTVRSRELIKYKRELERTHFAETPSRKVHIEKMIRAWQQNSKVLLTGPTGTGKTELAKRAARKYSGEPTIVHGNANLTVYEVYGKPKLVAERLSEEDLSQWQDKLMATTDEREFQVLMAQFQNIGGTVSGFSMGPIPKAAYEGKICIEDEINTVESRVLMRQKADANLRPGDTMTVPENGMSRIQVKEGYGLAATANVKSPKYNDREKLDDAIIRLFSSETHYVDYFPVPELFDLCLAKLVDRKGGLRMAPQEVDLIKQSVEAAVDIQKAYLGIGQKYYEKGGAATGKYAVLQTAVLDPGTLMSMMEGWQQAEAHQQSFRDFLEDKLIHFINNENYPQADRRLLVEILATKGFFAGRQVTEFLSPDFSDSDLRTWNPNSEQPKTLSSSYLAPRQIALLDPFGIRPDFLRQQADEFENQAPLTESEKTTLLERINLILANPEARDEFISGWFEKNMHGLNPDTLSPDQQDQIIRHFHS